MLKAVHTLILYMLVDIRLSSLAVRSLPRKRKSKQAGQDSLWGGVYQGHQKKMNVGLFPKIHSMLLLAIRVYDRLGKKT